MAFNAMTTEELRALFADHPRATEILECILSVAPGPFLYNSLKAQLVASLVALELGNTHDIPSTAAGDTQPNTLSELPNLPE